MLNPAIIKQQFPALRNQVLVYLDNAATTQMPESVINKISDYARTGRGNPYRGLHAFSEHATQLLMDSRITVAKFIGASPDELLFTKGTTEGLNLIARALGDKLGPGDQVVLSIFEHHANLLPWRELAKERGFSLTYLPMSANGSIDLEQTKRLIGTNTKVVAVMHASNVLGTILPVQELSKLAHAVGAWCVVDAAQTVAKIPIDVAKLGCDALAFGAHKMYGPEGVGALYVSERLRSNLKPLLYGGGMVDEVLDDEVRFAEDIRLFEAGSPNVSGAAGLAAACEFLLGLGLEQIREHELELSNYLLSGLVGLEGVKVHFPAPDFGRVGVVSLSINGVHSHDAAQLLADQGIAIRAGYHCAAPLTRCLDLSGTLRVSLGVYTLKADIDRFLAGVQQVLKRLTI